jgi:transmembrane sensor
MDLDNKRYFTKILAKYRLGKANDEEIKFLEAYYNAFELNEDPSESHNEEEYKTLEHATKKVIDERIEEYEKQSNVQQVRFLWIKYAAAALILLFVSFGIFLITRKSNIQNHNNVANTYKGITPGGNKAMLTLGNGTTILLEDAIKGEIAKQAGVIITKTANGQLVYKAVDNNTGNDKPLQNSISTPKGGQYKVILPDGTRVWLNAASSITYPTSFAGTQRLVSLTGEAYFEVAPNKQMPFIVKSGMQTVEVLGTHFNINAYADESLVKTTLLEGSVKVASAAKSAIIVPGEQAVIDRQGNGTITKRQLDTDQEVAWKNGVFSFKGEDIRSVMRQIGRWYNIDVVYESNLSEDKYFGEISRESSLANVFKILELNNVKFDIHGKTVTVSSK